MKPAPYYILLPLVLALPLMYALPSPALTVASVGQQAMILFCVCAAASCLIFRWWVTKVTGKRLEGAGQFLGLGIFVSTLGILTQNPLTVFAAGILFSAPTLTWNAVVGIGDEDD